MIQAHSGKLRARQGWRQQNQFIARLGTIAVAAMLMLAACPAIVAGEEMTGSGSGDLVICGRALSPSDGQGGGYGSGHCITRASLATGPGPAPSRVGDDRRPLQAAVVYRLRNSYARPEFAEFDLEKTARSRVPIAIWMLSYNIKELASTLPAPEQYWTDLRLRRNRSIGLSALDPGIERNPTGLKAVGLRILLPY